MRMAQVTQPAAGQPHSLVTESRLAPFKYAMQSMQQPASCRLRLSPAATALRPGPAAAMRQPDSLGSSFAVLSPRRQRRVLYERSQPDDHVGPDFWGSLRVSRARSARAWRDLVFEASGVSQQLATVVAVCTLSFLLQQAGAGAQALGRARAPPGQSGPRGAGCGARQAPDRCDGRAGCPQPGPVRAAAWGEAGQGRAAVRAADGGRGPHVSPAPDAHAVRQQVWSTLVHRLGVWSGRGDCSASELGAHWLSPAPSGADRAAVCSAATPLWQHPCGSCWRTSFCVRRLAHALPGPSCCWPICTAAVQRLLAAGRWSRRPALTGWQHLWVPPAACWQADPSRFEATPPDTFTGSASLAAAVLASTLTASRMRTALHVWVQVRACGFSHPVFQGPSPLTARPAACRHQM